MLRALSVRNFVVVETLDVEFDDGLTVLTGETGAGKSMLVDALALLLGDRFELRQLRPGADRAELAALFDASGVEGVPAWLDEQGFGGDPAELMLRRVLDAQGRSRGWINGRPATLAQLCELGERLVDLHGQHAHQALARSSAQRELLDAFGGFATLTRETGDAFRNWRALEDAVARARSLQATAATERAALTERIGELAELNVGEAEWPQLVAAQARLANAAGLIDTTRQVEAALDGDDALVERTAQLVEQLKQASVHDAALLPVADALAAAHIQLDDVAHTLRDYLRKLDLDPAELARVEERLAALHQAGRKLRVRPEELPALLAQTQAQLAALSESADVTALAARAETAARYYRGLTATLSKKRRLAAVDLSTRVTAAMQELAMAGGRMEVALVPLADPASHGVENIEFSVASHPKQVPGPLGKVASGGELSRIALAIQVATSEVGGVPTLVFDEVDTGIGGAVAATVGRLLQGLGARRQVLCVTHLPQVAVHADQHYVVTKLGSADAVRSELARVESAERIEELARMLGGAAITAKTRAHAKELLSQHRRPGT
jgi:DNA repair protein RecN (Recombination protein N)